MLQYKLTRAWAGDGGSLPSERLNRAAWMGMGGPDVAPSLGIAVHAAGSGGCREQIGGKIPHG